MEQEILRKIKKECKRKQVQREYCVDLLSQISELEKDESVKKYIELKEELEKSNYRKIINETDEQILYNTFYSHQHMIKKPEDIYICLGTFMMDTICDIEHGPHDIRLQSDDPRAEYRIYRNLENGYSHQISIRRCEEFEKTHTIIFTNKCVTDRYFYELQKEYINTLISYGPKQARQRILRKKFK